MTTQQDQAATLKEEKITTYKGFDKNLQCREFQYEIGKTYIHEGRVKACQAGFHACEYPLDVFGYYPPADSRFAVVEQSGELSRDESDTKVASKSITVKAEIDIPFIVKAAIEYTTSRCTPVDPKSPAIATEDKSHASNTGDYSAASNTGYQSAASNTGYRSAASNTGNRSAASNTGYQSAASNTGYQSAASNTGYRSAASNTGNRSAASNTGDYSAASNTGNRSAASNTGYQSAASNTGDYSAASNTGYQSAASNTGDYSAASNTGDYSAASNTGNRSAASNTGDYSAASNTGNRSAAEILPRADNKPQHSMACAMGYESKARAPMGSAIVLVYRNDDYELIHIRASKVGDNGIKPNVWYQLDQNGEFIEVAA